MRIRNSSFIAFANLLGLFDKNITVRAEEKSILALAGVTVLQTNVTSGSYENLIDNERYAAYIESDLNEDVVEFTIDLGQDTKIHTAFLVNNFFTQSTIGISMFY